MLSAIWNVEMTQRSICLPDFPAVSHVRRYSLLPDRDERQIGRGDRCRLKQDQELFKGLSRFLYLLNQGRPIQYREISRYHSDERTGLTSSIYPWNAHTIPDITNFTPPTKR
jgi:hypothetical protein